VDSGATNIVPFEEKRVGRTPVGFAWHFICDGTNLQHLQLNHVPTNRNDITTQLTRQLVERLGERPVAMWFKDTQLSIEENRLRVRAGTRFAADWIRRRFGDELQRLAIDIIDTNAGVDIEVEPHDVRSKSKPTTGTNDSRTLHAIPSDRSIRGRLVQSSGMDRRVTDGK
jgi:hypothetical protein